MSLPERTEVQCRGCGKMVEVTVFQSINDSWPDAAEKIMSDELFRFTCPHCGRKDRLEYDILFNDFKHRAWIQVVHDPEMIPKHIEVMHTMGGFMSDLRMRIVHDTFELREKVTAFALGRDDRIIELCKLAGAMMALMQLPDFQFSCNPIYIQNPETGEELFMLYGTKGEQKYIKLDEQLYKAMKTEYLERIDNEENRYVYDFDCAKEMFE